MTEDATDEVTDDATEDATDESPAATDESTEAGDAATDGTVTGALDAVTTDDSSSMVPTLAGLGLVAVLLGAAGVMAWRRRANA